MEAIRIIVRPARVKARDPRKLRSWLRSLAAFAKRAADAPQTDELLAAARILAGEVPRGVLALVGPPNGGEQ